MVNTTLIGCLSCTILEILFPLFKLIMNYNFSYFVIFSLLSSTLILVHLMLQLDFLYAFFYVQSVLLSFFFFLYLLNWVIRDKSAIFILSKK